MRVGVHSWPGYETLFLARELGVLSNDARLIEMPSPTDSLSALMAQEVEGAALTLDETLRAREGGLDLRVVLVFDVSAGADVVLARHPFADLRGIAGKKIGLDTSAVGALMLDSALRKAGLKLSDVHPVQLTLDRHVDAFRRGEIDIVITGEPISGQLEAEGARRVFDSSEVPGLIVDVLAVEAAAIARHRAALRSLLAAHFVALKHLHNHPADAAQKLAPRMRIPPESVLGAFKGMELPDLAANRRWLLPPELRLEQSAKVLQAIMVENKLLQRVPVAGPLADGRFLPQAS
jgi:NitT/TauT family transport system substrate-binding protein